MSSAKSPRLCGATARSEPYKSGVTRGGSACVRFFKNSFHFLRSFWTPLMFSSAQPEKQKIFRHEQLSPRTRGSAALPFMRKISHPSLLLG